MSTLPIAAGRGKPLAALLLLLPVPTLAVLAGMIWWPDTLLGKTLFGGAKIWILLLPLVWHRWVDNEPLSLSPARRGGWLAALATGIPIALLVYGAYLLVRHQGWIDPQMVRSRAELTGLANPAMYLAGALCWITVNSLLEEYVWRWFVQRQFERLIGGWAAVVASALGFTLHHVFALAAQFDWKITAVASAGVFVGGLVWGSLYLRYRSVWPCWLSHACVDLPIFVAGWQLIFG
ncbi:MAG TPA: CPBP family intramembrane glutamic endopeptidase [Luteolibacter sp.]|nr:CPBP family intramembrane glutamic endopeptidase [Luteolibacter sp.]